MSFAARSRLMPRAYGVWTYKTTDALATVADDNYFLSAFDMLRIGDRIYVTQVTGLGTSAETYVDHDTLAVVTSSSAGVTTDSLLSAWPLASVDAGTYFHLSPGAAAWTAADSPGCSAAIEFRVPSLPVVATDFWVPLALGISTPSASARMAIRLFGNGRLNINSRTGAATSATVNANTKTGLIAANAINLLALWAGSGGAASTADTLSWSSGTALPQAFNLGNGTANVRLLTDTFIELVEGVHYRVDSASQITAISNTGLGVYTNVVATRQTTNMRAWLNGQELFLHQAGVEVASSGYQWSLTTSDNISRRVAVGHHFNDAATPGFLPTRNMGYVDGGSGDVPWEIGLAYFSTIESITSPSVYRGDMSAYAATSELLMGRTPTYDAAAWAAGRNDGTGGDLTVV